MSRRSLQSLSMAFIVGNLQFSIATCSLRFFSDVAIGLDNVAIEFWSSSLVLVMTGMSWVVTQEFVAPSSLYFSASGNCRDIISFVSTRIFLFNLSTLSQKNFYVPTEFL